jgi:hypothetical protein
MRLGFKEGRVRSLYLKMMWKIVDMGFYWKVLRRFPALGGHVELTNGIHALVLSRDITHIVLREVRASASKESNQYIFIINATIGSLCEKVSPDGVASGLQRITQKMLPVRKQRPTSQLLRSELYHELRTLEKLLTEIPDMELYKDMMISHVTTNKDKLDMHARTIQRAWRRSVCDPAYRICKRRLIRELSDLQAGITECNNAYSRKNSCLQHVIHQGSSP